MLQSQSQRNEGGAQGVTCNTCGFDLGNKVLSIESTDDVLWEYSGLYCPSCFIDAVLERAPDFERLRTSYRGFKKEMVSSA